MAKEPRVGGFESEEAGAEALGEGGDELIRLISDHTDERIDISKEHLDDNLARGDMVEVLSRAILGTEPPFTFGVFGTWGSGKTYFMKLVRQWIIEHGDLHDEEGEPIVVEFEAWRHVKDERPDLSLVLCAFKALEKLDVYKALAPEVGVKIKNALKALVHSFSEIKLEIPKLVTITANPAEGVKHYEELSEQDDALLSEKKNQIGLKQKFDVVLDAISSYDSKNGTKNHRIVFMIDDLDRCSPDDIVSMLEKIKLYLWHKSCVFVLGADEGAIQKAIQGNGRWDKADAERYLEKIVNFPFRLPPVGGDTNKGFFKDKLSVKEPEIEIFNTACDHAGASLRTMVQLKNTYEIVSRLTIKAFERAQMSLVAVEAQSVPSRQLSEPADFNHKVMAILVAFQVLYPNEFNRLCHPADQRTPNIESFFTSEGLDGLQLHFKGQSEPTGFTDFHKQTRALKIDIANIDFDYYIEFLVASDEPGAASSSHAYDWVEPINVAGNLIGVITDIRAGRQVVSVDGHNWLVLTIDKDNQQALLLRECLMGWGPIDEPATNEGHEFDWNDCSLKRILNSRSWLKHYLPGFSRPAPSRLLDSPNGKVFLLSHEEVDVFMSEINPFAKHRVPRDVPEGRRKGWWLRSPGSAQGGAAYVDPSGRVDPFGDVVRGGVVGVRPALWLNLES